MIKKNTIFDFLAQIMIVWGISTLSLCLFCFLFGESAKGYSSIFAFGNEGISLATLLQFLCLAVVISTLRWLFFTDALIKKMSIAIRTIVMFACSIVAVAIAAAGFGWFPINQVLPWIMFLLSFSICAAGGTVVSVLKEKSENRKMQEALERLKGDDL